MPEPPPPNVWDQLFDHIPTALRVVLGFLTFGLFTIAGVLWRLAREDTRRVDRRLDAMEKRIERRLEHIERMLWESRGNGGNSANRVPEDCDD